MCVELFYIFLCLGNFKTRLSIIQDILINMVKQTLTSSYAYTETRLFYCVGMVIRCPRSFSHETTPMYPYIHQY